ncbi:glycoside hydrolase 5 family protein [Acidilobus sp.]|uniref:glycoside hydrolase 5 family protein n=1 Tax=Acidilobus sp. TaxID=1872109 RepID=UPI003CFFC921
MRTEARGNLVVTDGSFRFLLGVNYWPRRTNIRMWRDWDEGALLEDINAMKSIGVRAVRLFLLDQDFVSSSGDVDQRQLERLRWLLDRLGDNNIAGFVTLLVGHMSGRNWGVPWAPDNDIYSPKAVEGAASFARQVAERVRDSRGLGGWVLSNEMSLVRRASRPEEELTLLRAVRQAIGSVDSGHVFSAGDVSDSYGQAPHLVRGVTDYVGPHLYLYDGDPVRHGYLYSGMLELFSDDGQNPVMLEEFGFSSLQYSEADRAAFIYEALYAALAHGASGAFVWCFSDFPDEADMPYLWRPLELGFGLFDRDGRPKPSADSFRRFSRELEVLEGLGLGGLRRISKALVVAPFYVFGEYQFADYRRWLGGLHQAARPTLLAHQLLTMAGAQASIRYEPELREDDPRKLVVFPSAISGLTVTWRRLLRLAEGGRLVYVSLLRGLGQMAFMHESATHLWGELFGVEPALGVGSPGVRLEGSVRLRLEADLGDLRAGHEVAVGLQQPVPAYDVRPVDAEVIATANGRPIAFAARRGSGEVILSLFPLEAVLADLYYVSDWSPYAALYRALAVQAGVEPAASDDPRVEVQVMSDGGRGLAFMISHWPGELTASLPVKGDLVAGNSQVREGKAAMPPRGVAVIRFG